MKHIILRILIYYPTQYTRYIAQIITGYTQPQPHLHLHHEYTVYPTQCICAQYLYRQYRHRYTCYLYIIVTILQLGILSQCATILKRVVSVLSLEAHSTLVYSSCRVLLAVQLYTLYSTVVQSIVQIIHDAKPLYIVIIMYYTANNIHNILSITPVSMLKTQK